MRRTSLGIKAFMGLLALLFALGASAIAEGSAALIGSAPALGAGQSVALASPDAQLSAETDASGAFRFDGLAAGDYTVYVPLPQGCVPLDGSEWRLSDKGDMAWISVALAEGQTLTLPEAAFTAPPAAATISFSAFLDSNLNGARGPYERSLAGVMVEALGAGDSVLASGMTDANGEAKLTVAAASCRLRVTLPNGYRFTVKGEETGAGFSCVEDEGTATATSGEYSLSGGSLAVGAAALPVGSFSGRVWNDVNNDGVMQEDEPGMAGVTLTLVGEKNGGTHTLVSDDTGVYRFERLRNDTYKLTVELPEGTLFARYSLTGGDLRSVITVEGTKGAREFVVSGAENVTSMNVGVIYPAVLRGVAFLDINYNGIQDPDEPPYKGVTLEAIKNSNDKSSGKVVTGADGSYAFSGLRGGDYRLRAILPNDGSTFTTVPADQGAVGANRFAAREGRRENSIQSIVVNNGQTVETVVGVALGAAISGTVYVDSAYDGVKDGKDKTVSGVKVQLVDAAGALVTTATTGPKGAYSLEGVMPGTYVVRILRKNDYAFTRYRPNEAGGSHVLRLAKDGYGETETITVSMGQDIGDINAGMLPSSTVSGVLFDDLNDNGLRDADEAGYIAATVRLLSADGELDLTEFVGADGAYFFDGVMPGEYTLTYQLPEHAEMARTAAEGNTQPEITTKPFSIEMGKAYTLPLAGAVTLGSYEGLAFHDRNANGVQDADEEALPGAHITLAPDQGESAATASGADGRFMLTALRPGAYRLTLELPEGYIFSHDLEASGLTLQTAQKQTLDCPWAALINREVNLLGAVQPATVIGAVWLDEDKDGVQADSERMLSGLRFELIDERTQRVTHTAASAADGTATLSNVRPGRYTLRFVIPEQAEPAADALSTFRQKDEYMTQTGVTVAEGETFTDAHAGLVSRTSIGGKLYLDENGVRGPVQGVAVRLMQNGAELDTVSTDENGAFRFNGLWPGEYTLRVKQPEGMIFVRPDDAKYGAGASAVARSADGWGESDVIALRMAEHQTELNVLLMKPAKVGDQAWLDSNRNGLVDAGEPVIPGVEVTLLDANGEPAATTKTNEWGYYLFEDVYPGTYRLRASAYPELEITKAVPALRIISSCLTSGSGTEAYSDPFDVVSGTRSFDNDLGFALKEGAAMPSAIVDPPVQDWTVQYAPAEEPAK